MLKNHRTSLHPQQVENAPCVAVWYCYGPDLVYGVPAAPGDLA